jgi:hypothetical protein
MVVPTTHTGLTTVLQDLITGSYMDPGGQIGLPSQMRVVELNEVPVGHVGVTAGYGMHVPPLKYPLPKQLGLM